MVRRLISLGTHLDYRVVVQCPQVATAEHGVRARVRVVAEFAETRVELLVDDGHFQRVRVASDSQIEDGRLESRQNENEEERAAGHVHINEASGAVKSALVTQCCVTWW